MSRKQRRWKKRKMRWLRINRHHLTAKSAGGNSDPSNILNIYIERHEAWHKIFGNRSLEEVIRVLERLAHMKNRKTA